MIYKTIAALAEYAVQKGLIGEEERIYSINLVLGILKLDEYEEPEDKEEIRKKAEDLEQLLKEICDYAAEHKLIENDSVVYRDLFDTQVMNCFVPRPSEVIRTFWEKYQSSPKEATDYFYELSKASDYIRDYRIKKDIKFVYASEYGDMDITINLSKPEKDPKAIAAAGRAKQSGYPKCQLCIENEGYAGRVNHPARENHRIIPVTICGQDWGFQYSPYVYYNEHCILLNSRHIPMVIDKSAFEKLFDFLRQFPHYIIISNADLPIVGGSILSHEHFQGGNYEFPLARAKEERSFTIKGYEDVETCIVRWPLSVIRIRSKDTSRLVELADHILKSWRAYTDEEAFILAYTDQDNHPVAQGDQAIPHNTITPIARRRGEYYELDLTLRNNITTKERPLGVYHPRNEYHHIKKENIGGIEVMGLAILPSRLKTELAELETCILEGKDIRSIESLEKHADWVEEFLPRYEGKLDKDNIEEVLRNEVGRVFVGVLEDAGVFKTDEKGREYFKRFTDSLS
ncbi:MAG: UDP-glucose--hexose-1-phosphate uridylyltransferase [Lachnospiraceae bacterium]|nr:UDP-glucose--hexose-1-phosphate uridylyltransferase [Lachnospiraceae bacterium]